MCFHRLPALSGSKFRKPNFSSSTVTASVIPLGLLTLAVEPDVPFFAPKSE